MSLPPPTDTLPPKKGTNWLLVGCGGCLGLIILGALAMGAVMYFGIKAIKNSPTFQDAVLATQNSPAVQAEIGTPINPGFSINSKTNIVNGRNESVIDFPVTGPKGGAKVHYATTTEDNKVVEKKHTVTIDGSGKEIDLSSEGAAGADAATGDGAAAPGATAPVSGGSVEPSPATPAPANP